MRRICFILCLALALALPALALGAQEPTLWLYPRGLQDEAPVDAITWYKSGKEYWLFLPAALDLTDAQFDLENIGSLTISGVGAVNAGDSAAFLKEKDYSIKLNKKSAVLHVMRGSEGLPALFLTTSSGSLTYIEGSKERKEPGELIFVGPDGDVQYDGALAHIKTRGNSSQTFVKKNYQIKLEKGTDLMGFGKAKKWILTGNYRDKSHLRNRIMLDLADWMGLPYTPERCFAEVYINHEYRGLYLFSEKIEIGSERVDIQDLEAQTEDLNGGDLSVFPLSGSRKSGKGRHKAYSIPEDPADITGGYLVEYESYTVRYSQEPSVCMTKKGNVLVVKSPEYTSEAQMNYVVGRLQAFENAIFAADGADPETGLHWTEIVDPDSLAAKYMLEEFCKNYDGNISSQYFFKPEDSVSTRFYAGPAWDYDSSFGSYAQKRNAKNVLSAKGLWIANNDRTAWYPQLYRQADFRARVEALWQQRMKQGVEILLGQREAEDGLQSVDAYADAIRASAAMDYKRWPRLANPSTVAQTGHTFKMNIDYLKDFMQERYDFLCEEWTP